jgi:hypothetical protein
MDDLEFAFRKADAEARTYTEHDPPATPGIARWGRTNRFLRDCLVPRDWTYSHPQGLPMTTSPDRAIAIVATTGDERTGVADASPTTKYAKGPVTVNAVRRNEQHIQDALFDLPSLEDGKALAEAVYFSADETRVWLLLYTVTGDGIRAELSCPASITDQGFVDEWDERIILPFLPFEEAVAETGEDGSDGGNDQGIDVPVERR